VEQQGTNKYYGDGGIGIAVGFNADILGTRMSEKTIQRRALLTNTKDPRKDQSNQNSTIENKKEILATHFAAK
jgi:hypothetical protein